MKKTLITILLLLISAMSFCATYNVKDFGAKGDGKTDDTKAFNDALSAAFKDGGGIVKAPVAQYCIKGNISIPPSVTLQGEWTEAPLYYSSEVGFMGSTLLAYAGKGDPEAKPFITLEGHMASIRGFCINYPEWSQTIVPPIPYPPTIYGRPGDNYCIENINLHNAYDGIVFDKVGRFYINNVQGYPSHRGIVIDKCFDVGRIENVHFWPFGVVYAPADPYCEWINLNATAFEFNRTDWQYVTNTFCFGYGIGYHLKSNAEGASNGSMLCVGSDCSRRSVVVEDIQKMGWAITNGEFVGRWGSDDSIGVDIIGEKVDGKINISNSAFWGPLTNCVRCDSPNATLSLNNNTFTDWDMNYDGSPAVDLRRGRAVVNANTFEEKLLDIKVGKDMGPTIITSNLSYGGLKVENLSKDFVSLSNNQPPTGGITDKEKENYVIQIGSPGDTKYSSALYGSEPAANPIGEGDPTLTGFQRWTRGDSCFNLPTIPGKKYHVTFNIFVPEFALTDKAGFYYKDNLIIAFSEIGTQKVEADIEATEEISRIYLKCKPWMPSECLEGYTDTRKLGILVRSIEMKMEGTKEEQVLANKI